MKNPFTLAQPVQKKLKILLYGASGSGKTLAALTFPRVALIDSEGGTDLYAGRPGIQPFHILRTKSITELENAVQFIQEDNGKSFDTLVIDPITVFYDILKDAGAKKAKGDTLGMREWAMVNSRMKSVYNILTQLPVHVIVLARESVEYETKGSEFKKAGYKPDADKALVYIMDFVIRMQPDHSGIIEKSRGITLGQNGHIPAVNWQVFEPVSNAFVEGETIVQKSDDEVAAMEAPYFEPSEPKPADDNGNKHWTLIGTEQLKVKHETGLSVGEAAKMLGLAKPDDFEGTVDDFILKVKVIQGKPITGEPTEQDLKTNDGKKNPFTDKKKDDSPKDDAPIPA